MKIVSDVFDEIEVSDEKVIKFEDGIPGFESEKEFVFINNTDDAESPFVWMQSAQTPELAFLLIDPFKHYSDYDIELSDVIVDKLKIEDPNDVGVLTMVSIPENPKNITTNLQGPIVVNLKSGLGKQVILDDPRWTVRHYILPESERGE